MTAKSVYPALYSKADKLRTIKARLRGLAAGDNPRQRFAGLCTELDIYECKYIKLLGLMSTWSEAANSFAWPVEGSGIDYAMHAAGPGLWSDSEYGRKRRRLCAWLADNITEDYIDD